MNVYFGIPNGDQINIEEKEIARRLISSLSSLPCHTRDFTTDDPYPFEAIKGTPSLIHAFHAAKGGLPCHKLAEKNRLPLVITCTGLDAYIDMYNTGLRTQLQETLEAAARLIVPFPQMGKFIKSRLQINTEIEVIPPGVLPISGDLQIPRDHFGLADGYRIILLDGGLLPAKNTLFAIHQLDRIIKDMPELQVVIIQSPSDSDYQMKVVSESASRPWIKIIERPEPELLPYLYSHIEVFVNVSHVEGYNPFTMLALQAGKPVLASDIYGNHALVKNEAVFEGFGTGWLYFASPGPGNYEKIHDGDDFIEKLRFILKNPETAALVGARAANMIRCSHTVEKEVYLHLQLYKTILAR